MSALVMLFALAAQSPAQSTQSIDHVVVFADRAEVTRTEAVRCDGGVASAVFDGLPESVDPRTLRGDASGDAVAVGVSSERKELEQALDARVKKLNDDLQDVDDKLVVLARAQEDENQRSHTMQSYAAYFRALAVEEMRSERPDAARWDKILDAIVKDGDTTVADTVARAAEQRSLERKRERLAARLQRLSPAAAPSSLSATVAVRCGKDAAPTVRLSYVVPGATWSPEYDLRFTGPARAKVGEGHATVTVAGVVRQSTGEDWSNAEVWLSTAKPLLGGEAPLPNPLWVSGAPEEKQKSLVYAQEHRAEDLKAGKQQAAGNAGFEDGGKAFVLKLPKRVTVHADGRPYWFPVDEIGTKARSLLVAVPARSPYVFQLASLANPARYPLMAGRVHVFRGPSYVGDVDIDYKAPGEPFEISLGLDEEIALERQDLMKEKREKGFFTGTQTLAHAYRTILRNRSDDDVSVEIREQIPVSKTSDVEVTLDDGTAPGYRLDKLRGHLTWTVPLKRGQSDQRDIAFTIKLPKEWAVH